VAGVLSAVRFLDQGAAVGEQGFDGGFDVLRLDQVEAGQVGEIEQGIWWWVMVVGAIKTGGLCRPVFVREFCR
jgi:hypothetical protein